MMYNVYHDIKVFIDGVLQDDIAISIYSILHFLMPMKS